MSDAAISSLVHRLVSAAFFEDAATAVLEVMFADIEEVIERSTFAFCARCLRGIVHLRPEGTYQRIFGLEVASRSPLEQVGYLTSSNVWRWLEEHRCSVSIDVARASLRAWLPGGPVDRPEGHLASAFPGDATRERMLDRDATHVHVVPLCLSDGSVDGVITLEASCHAAGSQEFVWEECHKRLELYASIARAFIAARALPNRSNIAPSSDEFLPVVGARTAPLVELLRAFAPRDDTILISGPTGAGKSRLARFCHEHSPRKGQAFEIMDLLGVPDDLQMAHLFGWKRGAFTGAVKDNPGAVARAAKGTLFLDEIDKLSLKAQAGLLHFLEERSYRMLGDDSSGERRADVRVLVGTNADLRSAMRAGRFREDLFYRINVLPVRLLPLDERRDELPRWADYMLQRRHCEEKGRGNARFSPDALGLLASAPWPGNLRQLDNIVRRAHALSLAWHAKDAPDLVVDRQTVERALTFDVDTEANALVPLLFRAAWAFVREAERREHSTAPLSLDMVDAFRGMVLGVAVRHRGNREEAFSLLDQHAMLKNRNHHKALHRELERVRALLLLLGVEANPELEAVLTRGGATELQQ